MRRALLILALSCAAPAFAQPGLEPVEDRIRREEPYRPRHLLPVAGTVLALGVLCVAWWRVRRAKAEALERLEA